MLDVAIEFNGRHGYRLLRYGDDGIAEKGGW